MAAALEVHGLAKRYAAGVGGCAAAAHVLRDVTLSVRAGEVVAIAGARGAGKSTLLLCLAGLIAPDAGQVRWFGDASRAAAARRVLYHVARTDLLRAGRIAEPNLHLVDVAGADPLELLPWIAARSEAGDAVVVAAGPGEEIPAARVLHLSRGRLALRAEPGARIRVAEPARS